MISSASDRQHRLQQETAHNQISKTRDAISRLPLAFAVQATSNMGTKSQGSEPKSLPKVGCEILSVRL